MTSHFLMRRTALLLSTVLSTAVVFAPLAFADGGKGGHSIDANKAAGGVNHSVGTGGGAGGAGTYSSAGASYTYGGGGGGGAGVSGGAGGAADGASGTATGGAGAISTVGGSGANGGNGGSVVGSVGGGAGGGGGTYGWLLVGSGTFISGSTGGNGGAGGDGSGASGGGSGGGGGSGAAALALDVTAGAQARSIGPASPADIIQGGHGGNGGVGYYGGSGGDGGAGILVVGANGLALDIYTTVIGGSAGLAGRGTYGSGSVGKTGSGVVGSNLTVGLYGAVKGGAYANSAMRAYAFEFTAGSNTLTLNTGWSIDGGIHIASGSLTLFNADDATLTSSISGAGNLIKNGAGKLVLTGSLANSGTITVNGGTLEYRPSTDGTFSRNMTTGAGANLSFGGAATQTYSGAISGGGGVVYNGSNVLILTGTSSYAGATVVESGRLAVNGVLSDTSGVTVKSGANLGGTGMARNVTIENGGVLAPGNSIGTLTIDGTLVLLAGSKLEIEIDDSGNSDELDVSGAATLGGVLHVKAATGTYEIGDRYDFLTAASVTGDFSEITTDLALLMPVLTKTATGAYIVLQRNGKTIGELARSTNQKAVVQALDALGSTNANYSALLPMTEEAIRTRLDQLSGDIHAGIIGAQMQNADLYRQMMNARLLSGEAGYWTDVYGQAGYGVGDGNGPSLGSAAGGFAVGFDSDVAGGRVGGMLAAGASGFDAGLRKANATSADVTAGLYGGTEVTGVQLRGGASVTWHGTSVNRHVGSDRLTSDYNGATSQVYAEVSTDFELGDVTVSPYAGSAYVHHDTFGFAENGGAAALTLENGDNEALVISVGVRAEQDIARENGTTLALSGGLGWQQTFGDAPTTTQTIGGKGFTVARAEISGGSLTFDAGLSWEVAPELNAQLSYAGQVSAGGSSQSIRAGLSGRF